MGLTQTPDMISAKKSLLRRFWQIIVKIIRFFFLGVVGMILIGMSIMVLPDLTPEPAAANSDPQGFAPLLVIPLTIYLSIAIHELGHFAGGVLVGFRFVLLGVGPLHIRREKRGLRPKFKLSMASLDGFIITVPTDDRDLKRRLAIVFAGGPLASLFQAALVYLVLFIWQDTLWIGSISVLVPLWVWSVACVVVSSLPVKVSGVMMDGARLLTLMKGGPQAERLCAYYALVGASYRGQRPRDLDPMWLQRVLVISDDSADEAYLNLLAYFHTLDKGEPDRAAIYLDQALSLWQKIPPFFRARYFLEAAYYEAIYGHNAVVARRWLGQAKGGLLLEKHTRLRAEAAVLLAEGKCDAAQVQASRGLNLLDRTVDNGRTKAAADWLQEIVAISAGATKIRDDSLFPKSAVVSTIVR